MAKKRPCKLCGKWFEPHLRAGERQRTCSSPDCQRERNRKACRRWRAKSDTPIQRLRKNIRAAKAASGGDSVSPVAAVQWAAMRHAVPAETLVVLQELVRLLDIWMRHAVALKFSLEAGQALRLPSDTERQPTDHRPSSL